MPVCCVDDSDDDREVSRKRAVRQAASRAVSKQREILMGDGGSEDEEQEDQEEPYMDRKCLVFGLEPTELQQEVVSWVGFSLQLMNRAATRTSWWRTTMTAITDSLRREARR